MSRNVVFLCLDTVRKDFFDEYAPTLRQMADVSFEQCRAASSWSVPSHASILTGDLPSEHGVHTYNTDFSEIKKTETFLESIPTHRSICVSANVWASSTFLFADHFDEYTDVSPRRRFSNGAHMKEFNMWYNDGLKYAEFLKFASTQEHPIYTLLNGVHSKSKAVLKRLPVPSPFDDGAKTIVSRSLDHIQQGSEPFFLFTNFMDAHGPLHHILGHDDSLHSVSKRWDGTNLDYWDVNLDDRSLEDEADIQRYRELYGTAIEYLDRQLAIFIERLREETDEETTILITADHGENLGFPEDEGLFNHVGSLSESLLHVPLYIINPPDGYNPIEREYFSHLDIGELIRCFADDEIADTSRDSIPAELIGGNLATRNNVPEEQLDHWDRMQRCVYQDEEKWLWDSNGGSFKYKIDHDRPCWQQIMEHGVAISPKKRELFSDEIHTVKERAKNQSQTDLDSGTEERLEDLGYI